MKRIVAFAAVAVLAVAPFAGGSIAQGAAAAPRAHKVGPSPTQKVAGSQHWCGSNGITCSDPATNWDEIAGYAKAAAKGTNVTPYIGHDEPMVQFFSNRPGTGNDVTYQLRLPKDPPTLPRQDGSGGTDDVPAARRRSGSACSCATTRGRRTPTASR